MATPAGQVPEKQETAKDQETGLLLAPPHLADQQAASLTVRGAAATRPAIPIAMHDTELKLSPR
jgi:hypothetical protein